MGSTATEIARAATAANATMVKSQYEAVTNLPLVAAFVAFAVAQSLKVLTTWNFLCRLCMMHQVSDCRLVDKLRF
jgi:hypothetical protein